MSHNTIDINQNLYQYRYPTAAISPQITFNDYFLTEKTVRFLIKTGDGAALDTISITMPEVNNLYVFMANTNNNIIPYISTR